jgi:urease alpha subunit
MKTSLLILFIFLVSFSYGQQKTTTNDTYDLVILNGRVMDPETNFDGIRNVGVKDGRIALITE